MLNQLSQTLEDLPAADQRKAERILARPTDGNDAEDALLTYEDGNGIPSGGDAVLPRRRVRPLRRRAPGTRPEADDDSRRHPRLGRARPRT